MAAREGFRRITTLGRRTAIGGALLMLLGVFIQLWQSRTFNHQSDPAGLFLGPGFFLLVVGGILLLVGWIGDGFLTEKDSQIPSA